LEGDSDRKVDPNLLSSGAKSLLKLFALTWSGSGALGLAGFVVNSVARRTLGAKIQLRSRS
jgi:hypothetical protein